MIDLTNIKSIHIIGIGGVSNSAIAEILDKNGYLVSGSDIASTDITDKLITKGIHVFIGHQSENVVHADLVVYTSAVGEDNAELKYALECGIPCLSRAEMLGQIMLEYKNSIAIAGTHGKTTTTSMVTRLFNDSNFDPTALVGGYSQDIKSNVKLGKSDLFITEACEYKENFLSFYPKIGVILNIDEDHLDYYRDLDHIISAFVKFAKNIENKGTLILNGDDYNSRKIIPYYNGKLITFGLADHCDYIARNIVYDPLGCPSFDIFRNDIKLCKISLLIPGIHNIYNTLAAFIVGTIYSDDIEMLESRLSTFKNANRRFELIGTSRDITIVDDYAHHPSEIKATLEAAARMTDIKRILCVFQPHTYSRTKELLNEFSCSFGNATEVLLCNIYAARETDHGEVSSKDLLNALLAEGVKAHLFDDFEAVTAYIKTNALPNDLILTMGAGDVYKVSKMALEAIK